MVPSVTIARAAASVVALALLLPAAGCAYLPRWGGSLDEGNGGAKPPASKPAAAVTSVYEYAPAAAWQKHAVGMPASPGLTLSRGVLPQWSCLAVPQGLSTVLPVRGGEGVMLLPGGVGVSGEPVAAFQALSEGDGLGLAKEAMARNARYATHGQGCTLNLFVYGAFAGVSSLQPVVVR